MKRTRVLLTLPLLVLGACATASGGGPGREVIGSAGGNAPYVPGIRTGDLVFFSGQIGSAPGRGLVEGGIEPETAQALANVNRLLEQAGLDRGDVVKCTVFLADIRDYGAMNRVYAEFFRGSPPARSAVGVAGLPASARVEVECIARTR